MDIRVYGSSAGNLGGSPTAEIPDNSLHLLFPPLSQSDLASGKSEYRCVFLKNVSNDKTYFRVTVEVIQPPDGQRNPVEKIYIGVDPQKGSSIQQIPNSSTAPSGVTFFLNVPVEIGMLGPNEVQGIWLKREVPPNTPVGGFVKVTLKISGYSLKSS
ncbi:MAG: hypothetical protein QW687_04050 [Candidatus Hadarchaeales archaeon]